MVTLLNAGRQAQVGLWALRAWPLVNAPCATTHCLQMLQEEMSQAAGSIQLPFACQQDPGMAHAPPHPSPLKMAGTSTSSTNPSPNRPGEGQSGQDSPGGWVEL